MIQSNEQKIVDQAITSRHSMRAFLPTPVAREDIEHHDVAEFLETNEMGQCTADITGADQSNFLAGHVASLPLS